MKMFKLHWFFFLYLLTYCRSGLSQDCSSVQCPEVETCPEGTETLLLNSTNSEDIYDECCIAFECRPIGCDLGIVQLESGEIFSPDPCMECICNTGTLNCTQKTCPKLKCRFSEYEGYFNGACCKSCIPRAGPDPYPTCRYGNFYTDPSNPCLSCTCHYGRTACVDTSGICEDLSGCSNVVKVNGQCCPICNDTTTTSGSQNVSNQFAECTTSTGDKHKEGESWSEESCKTCTCASGVVSCTEEVCPDITCRWNEVKKIPLGKCCPYCAPRLSIDPPFQPPCEQEGEFTDPTDPCKKCSCYNGLKACLKEICAPLPSTCSRVVRLEGSCCPACLAEENASEDDTAMTKTNIPSTSVPTTAEESATNEETTMPTNAPKTCMFHGRILQDRDRVSDGSCAMCICLRGYMACTQHVCPEIECPPFQQPIYSPDKCCPTECGPSSSTSVELDRFTGTPRVIDDLTSTLQVTDDSTIGPWIVDEKPDVVVDKFPGKGTNQFLKGQQVQDTPNNVNLQQATPGKAQQDEITSSRSFIIVCVGVGSLIVLMALSTISLIVIKNRWNARTKKQESTSETV